MIENYNLRVLRDEAVLFTSICKNIKIFYLLDFYSLINVSYFISTHQKTRNIKQVPDVPFLR